MMKKIGQAAGLLVLLALASSIVLVRFGGIGIYSVMSGSMVPQIPVGSVVLVTPADPSAVRVGDVITFQLPDRVVTHRVIAIASDANGLLFTTKGDANQVADQSPIRLHNAVGVVRAAVPAIGYFVVYAQMYWRLVAMGLAAIVLLVAAGMLLFTKPRALTQTLPMPTVVPVTPAKKRAAAVAVAMPERAVAMPERPAPAARSRRAPAPEIVTAFSHERDELWISHLAWLQGQQRVPA